MSVQAQTITIPLPSVDDTVLVLKAPAAGKGGGLRITEATIVNHAATSSTVGFAVALHRMSSAGTPVLNGTVAGAIGGTAASGGSAHFADSVPRDMPLTTDRIRAGEWLALNYVATNAGTPTRGYVSISYVMGQ